MQTVQTSWESLLRPKSVAMVGASERNDFTNKFKRNMENIGYINTIYYVNPKRDNVFGEPCYPSLEMIPEQVECALISVPSQYIPKIIKDGLEKGIKAFVIHASGFMEASSEGQTLQSKIQEMCRKENAIVVGPNCLGLINIKDGISLYGAPMPDSLPKGNVGVVTQSGSASIVLMNNARKIGFTYIASTGNEAVLTAEDLIDYYIEDPDTQVIAVFLESLRQPRRFIKIAKRAVEKGKPIIAMKVGLSSQGKKVSLSHTGALAGSSRVYEAVLKECGVIQVNDFDEMVETIEIFSRLKDYPEGSRTAILGISGGELALAADISDSIGLTLSDFETSTISKLSNVLGLPERIPVLNPFDVGTGIRPGDFEEKFYQCLLAIGKDSNVDIIAVSQDAQKVLPQEQVDFYKKISKATARASSSLDKPVVFFSHLSAGFHPEIVSPVHQKALPLLQGTRTSLQAIKHVGSFGANFFHFYQNQEPLRSKPITDVLSNLNLSDREFVGERETKYALSEYGVPVTNECKATTENEAKQYGREIGFPVVLKVESPDVIHKSDIGGVRVGLSSEEDIETAFREIISSVNKHHPDAVLSGIVVQEQVSNGIELIIGVKQDAQFGPVIVIGLGGIMVEVLNQVAISIPPINKEKALKLLQEFPGHEVLEGHRGRPLADINAIAEVLVKVSQFAMDSDGLFSELDINPLVVGERGQGCSVVDARIISSIEADKIDV